MSKMGIDEREVRRLLSSAGIVPKRSLGQNFLTDPQIAKLISDVITGFSESSIEIGPGLGSLTVQLSASSDQVVAIEKDETLAALLISSLIERGISNVEVLIDDALHYDFEESAIGNKITCVAGNLPYNISVPLILRILESAPTVQSMVFLVQTEVARRLCAKPGSKDASMTSLITNFYSDPQELFDVPNSSFTPAPNVGSTLIAFVRTNAWISGYGALALTAARDVARLAFSHRRQMLRRSLSDGGLRELLFSLDIDETRRPETLTVLEWANIGKEVLATGIAHHDLRET